MIHLFRVQVMYRSETIPYQRETSYVLHVEISGSVEYHVNQLSIKLTPKQDTSTKSRYPVMLFPIKLNISLLLENIPNGLMSMCLCNMWCSGSVFWEVTFRFFITFLLILQAQQVISLTMNNLFRKLRTFCYKVLLPSKCYNLGRNQESKSTQRHSYWFSFWLTKLNFYEVTWVSAWERNGKVQRSWECFGYFVRFAGLQYTSEMEIRTIYSLQHQTAAGGC